MPNTTRDTTTERILEKPRASGNTCFQVPRFHARFHRTNPRRCARKAAGFERSGRLDPRNPPFTRDRIAAVRDAAADRLAEPESLDRKHAEPGVEGLMPSSPETRRSPGYCTANSWVSTNSRFGATEIGMLGNTGVPGIAPSTLSR